MAEAFPPIHLYALLAAAIALMSMPMGRNLYGSDQSWSKRWTPFLAFVLAVLHIAIFIGWHLVGHREPDWHLAIHGAILLGLVITGGRVYADHLYKTVTESSSTLPPLEPEPDGS